MTYLCVPIFVESIEQARRDALLAYEAGADIVEYRIDDLTDSKVIRELAVGSLPCILTCRPEWEGGHSKLETPNRIELLEAPLNTKRYIDIELKTLKGASAVPLERRIVSVHDFSGRPDRLYNVVEELNASASDVNKIVWLARSIRDNLEAFEIIQSRQKPTIALCMGEAGLISRVLAKKFGAFLTFASLRDTSATAPGQITIHDMKRLYRWDAIDADTRVCGVVGSPVMHSMSPALHNAAFEKIGFNGVYLPLLVNEGYESFKAFMESFLAFDGLHLSGLSITIPHKENALRYLKEVGGEIEPLAERIGALNTIVIDRNRQSAIGDRQFLKGFSTDYAAILDSITTKLNITRDDLANYRVAVIGAGGTGRTAVAALAHYGATVVVYNRTGERADALAKEFDGHSGKVVSARMEKLCDSCCHIFINTTSVGMHPNVDASPLGDQTVHFSPETLVFDTIYNPIKTKFLQQAEAAGAKTIGGVEMFVRQAVGQFEAWTGQPAPSATMREVVERRLLGKDV